MTTIHELSIAHLRKQYGARTVVKDVSFHVKSGEVVGLLGPNGAGKTSCFYMVVGLIGADAGDVLIDGDSLRRLPMHKRAALGISYLPQEPSIFRKLTVEENIRAVLELQYDENGKRLTRAQINKDIHNIVADLQIGHILHSPAPSLSGGERRRVEIARTLATRPRFVLLDEPFAGVDPIAVSDIQKIIHFLVERGIGVLITDHNVRETLGICDRAYIISEGVVLAHGNAQEIVDNEAVRRVYLGDTFTM
jgi:lipopolysaccharide export system ATP-binding protein